MKIKRVLTLFLCLTLAVSLMTPFSVMAETVDLGETSGTCGESLTWEYNEVSGALTVSGDGEMTDFHAKQTPWHHLLKYIYSVYIEDGVTSVGNWAFAYCYQIRQVNFPESSLTRIGYNAFYQGFGLEEVFIPESVSQLGNAVFAYCKNLTAVSVPVAVTQLNKLTFYGCESLKKIYYAGSISQWNAISKDSSDAPYYEAADIVCDTVTGITWTVENGTLTVSGVGRMDSYGARQTPWYPYADEITKIVVEEGVSGLGNRAFAYLSNVTAVYLPESLVHIGAAVFYKCTALEEITLPTGLKTLSNSVFYNCTSLKTINIPVGIKTVNNHTFLDCPALETVNYHGTEYQWSKVSVLNNNEDLLSTNICFLTPTVSWTFDEQSSTLTVYGTAAMDNYVSGEAPWYSYSADIKAVVIGEGVPNIGDYAFYKCSNLETVTVADSVTYIGTGAFYDCTVLCEADLPEEVTYIGTGAFYNNASLTRITLPNTVDIIRAYTFSGCESLDTVYFGGTREEFDALTVASNNEPFVNAKSVMAGQFPPEASVTELGSKEVPYSGNTYTLDSAYSFDALETFDDVNSDYKYFHADFVVSFDKDVNDVVLAGYYKMYAESVGSEDWVPVTFEDVKAGEQIRVLDEKWFGGEGSVNYQELCAIEQFHCGVVDEDGDDFGTTVTVELRLYETEAPSAENNNSVNVESGVYVTVGTYTYTFPEKAKPWEFDSETGTLYIYENTEDYTEGTAPWYEYASEIKAVSVDSTVTYIGSYAFAGTAIESYTVPEFMTAVPEGLFANSGISAVTIPGTVTSVGANAFADCDSLETVNYCGSRVAFGNVTVSDGNDPLLNASWNYEIYQGYIFKNKFTEDFLYRVGNSGDVLLSTLFEPEDGMTADSKTVNVTVTALDADSNVAYTYTPDTSDWTQSKLSFTGIGPVRVSISDLSYETVINLEVVSAKNVTAYSGLSNTNCVLLNDIKMSSGGSFYLTNAVLYGNGFQFDVTDGATAGTGGSTNNYLVSLIDAGLDNVEIIGKVYTSYGVTASAEFNRPTVLVSGESYIANCYISNCASPVRVNGGTLEIVNTTLKGGTFANLDIRDGNITLENVTTVNQVSDNDNGEDGETVVGFGIVSYYENVPEGTTITVKGDLTQYNYLAKSDKEYLMNSQAQAFFTTMFGTEYSDYIYTDADGESWLNTGIVSMMETVGEDQIIDERSSHTYLGQSAVAYGKTGYVYAPAAAEPVSPDSAYVSSAYSETTATPTFDYTSKNYVPVTDGSNIYCYYTNGAVNISFDDGTSFAWDPFIMTAKKGGMELDYTVSMNGTEYTDEITFSQSGSYTVEYTYVDPYNYKFDENGNVVSYTETYKAYVKINATAVKPGAKHATFAFNGASSYETIDIGNKTYLSPASSTSTTVSGVTVNTTKVDVIMSDGKTSHTSGWYAYFPVLSGVVTITDYAEEGFGDEETFDASCQTMPSGLSVVGDPATLFKYNSSTSASSTPEVKKNILVYSSAKIEANRNEQTIYVEYCYQDNAGSYYYYIVAYYAAKQTYTSCVTADTLVTLADGTAKEVQYLTGDETLLVWNHETGKMDTAPIAYIVNHDGAVNSTEVITLYFEDGKEIDIIGEHVFYDMDTDKYVALDKNASDFIGHTFAVNGGDALEGAKLISVTSEVRETAAYEVVTYKNVTCFTNGILSASAYLDKVLNIFDIDADTKAYVNAAEDVQKYGLYTYADFEGLITEDAFELYNAQYLKVAVGKGYITWEDILHLIDIYFCAEVEPL